MIIITYYYVYIFFPFIFYGYVSKITTIIEKWLYINNIILSVWKCAECWHFFYLLKSGYYKCRKTKENRPLLDQYSTVRFSESQSVFVGFNLGVIKFVVYLYVNLISLYNIGI